LPLRSSYFLCASDRRFWHWRSALNGRTYKIPQILLDASPCTIHFVGTGMSDFHHVSRAVGP
jgi:hypothetical protein